MSLRVKIAHDSRSAVATVENLHWHRAFATDGLAAGDCYAAWRDADIAGLSTRYETTPHEPFSVAMDWLDLGTLGIGSARITAQDWDRSRWKANHDHNDDLVVNVRHAGAAFVDVDGHRTVAPAGSIVLADMAAPMKHFSEASLSTGFALPRALAEQMLPQVRSLHGYVVAPDPAALLVSHLATIRASAGHLPVGSGPVIAQTILDLFAMTVTASMGAVPSDQGQHERALLVQLRAAIEDQLGSPSLNTARLSRMLGVSRSTLYRLLQDQGGVQAYIRTRRLARVAAALRDRGNRQTVANLADDWGFCDAAYLGRAFREMYGITPGDYRALHGMTLVGGSSLQAPR